MPSRCCVTGCKGNYDSTGARVSTFRFPKDKDLLKTWIRAISRENFIPTNSSRVCQLHFKQDDIEKVTSEYISRTGELITVALKHPRLKSTAVPTIFPGCPANLRMPRTCCVPGCRSNYKGEPYTSIFSFPRDASRRKEWLGCVRRPDYSVATTPSAAVCIKHFEERFVERDHRATREDGTVLIVPRASPRLTGDALPTLFPTQPACPAIKLPEKSLGDRVKESFPKDENRPSLWTEAVGRSDRSPSRGSKLCSKHFREEHVDRTSVSCVRLKSDTTPAVFDAAPSNSRKPPQKKTKATATGTKKAKSKLAEKAGSSPGSIKPDSTSVLADDQQAGPSSRMENVLSTRDVLSRMSCDVYPVVDPESSIWIKQEPDLSGWIKQEPLEKMEILSTTAKQELDDCHKVHLLGSKDSNLFQPPVLIKDEIVSSEDEL